MGLVPLNPFHSIKEAYGQTTTPDDSNSGGIASSAAEPERLSAGVYLLNIGKVDLQTGSYDLDFYFWLASASNSTVDFTKQKPTFDFMNSMNAKIEPSRIEPNYYEVRVKGTFLKNMDFRNYPFDTQEVTVEVEGFETVDKLVFVPDTVSSGYDSLVNVPGWNLGKTEQSVIVHQYPDQSYSRYIFSFDIQRAALSAFLKTIFPVIIITTIAMLAFWMSPTNFPPRIGLAASTLLAAVAAHLAAASQLPPIGYLTLMDKVMIVAYALFLNNLVSMVLQMRLVDHKKEEQAAKVNAKMRKLMPVIIGVILAVLVPFDLRVV
ncbi:Neurotransmitter-gated ion-channel transmembrane region [Candidatus Nitrososphaera evergladensis SR1]|uniref:Neurotransmitter-gated ion-channel transmembrane region n=1 Tax=Candidatus Nitrososphaera evergladensis SR1 TaxID=1459636 RepID=A0A075MWK9_9ARCH|nr:Neurotransmitter-gated ion-channel transmembrane region [Candidatus Nitrososphaera evergladensis SR1]